MFSMPVVHCCL
uniref:Uncharacterized protein n=1 Tax=Anguilla anguilla TaxID=7936 RepID=A0A0E9STW7_ANGAN